ncbi:unnamed protein product [Danaus chrysippus]|uniref:(African queen) hypothetical protein n=1 Tax=Danaus chrysippus TaxID=151541 RepID=A0A8J2R7Z6_9NEOP|nr:unnamed protein product [Danaus chrysippus]
MAAVTAHLDQIKIQVPSDEDQEPYSPNTRDTTSPEYEEKDRQVHSSSFSIHNVLKKERDSPENVFSTEKLLQNTPNFEEGSRNSSISPRLDDERADISVDDSCCSDDTVLSVGNEAPVCKSPETQGITTFKHIQTHLNAISQLSQNLTMNQPILLRPNPIAPNPLMFLNQPMMFQNPLINHELKANVPRMQIPQNSLNMSQFNINFGSKSHKSDENRLNNQNFSPKSPDNESERDFINQSLKFSIDNILKADFGRRITDPLTKRKPSKARYEKTSPLKEVTSVKEVEARVPEVKPIDKGAIDLSKADDSGSNASSTPGKLLQA